MKYIKENWKDAFYRENPQIQNQTFQFKIRIFSGLDNSGEESEMHHKNYITLKTHLCKGLKSSLKG